MKKLPLFSCKGENAFHRIVHNTYVGAAIALAHSDRATNARLKIMLMGSSMQN
jgi:hypothetical protein